MNSWISLGAKLMLPLPATEVSLLLPVIFTL
jgi:hypothetical protein